MAAAVGRSLGQTDQESRSVLWFAVVILLTTAAGATVREPAHDVGGGRLVATVTDPDGNVLGLIQDR